LLVLLAIAVHAVLPQIATLEAMGGVLRRMRWWAVALAVVTQAGSYRGYAYTVQSAARLTRDRIGGWAATRVVLAASSVGVLSGGPVGYGAATYRWMRRRGVSDEGAVLCSWVPGFLNVAVLIACTAAGTTYLVVHHVLRHSQLVTLAILTIVLGVLALAAGWMLSSAERTSAGMAALRRGWQRIRLRAVDNDADATAGMRIILAHQLLRGGGWHRPLLGAIAKIGFDVATLFSLFVGTGYVIHPGALLAGYGLPQLIGSVSFLPGGIGIVEGGMTGLYVALDVPTPTTVLVVLAYRGLSFWIPTLLGFPLAVEVERSSRGAAHAATKTSART
jgi:uncharacterized membrane protein YbhN (UPF0104 family)